MIEREPVIYENGSYIKFECICGCRFAVSWWPVDESTRTTGTTRCPWCKQQCYAPLPEHWGEPNLP